MDRSSQSTTATDPLAKQPKKPSTDDDKKDAPSPPQRWRISVLGILFRLSFAAMVWGVVWVIINADRAIPAGWNPLAPLAVSDPVTPFTQWRLRQALATPEACLAALTPVARLSVLEDFEASDVCHIRNRVELAGVGQARLAPIETRCAIALRMAMWEEHSLQPAAREILQTTVTAINHMGSYNCRQMRTVGGSPGRMSTHATANAIDISGFVFADGTEARLIRDWQSDGPKAAFLRTARNGACEWFRLTLSPDYNALHADHFHLQSRGWGSCR